MWKNSEQAARLQSASRREYATLLSKGAARWREASNNAVWDLTEADYQQREASSPRL